MFNAENDVLYVGKARNLKSRVSSYFNNSQKAIKTLALVSQIEHIEVTRTHTEAEALLLENTLIKSLRPPYNVMLKDDKSYPYIQLTKHAYPRIVKYRARRANGEQTQHASNAKGELYGPYPNVNAVNASITHLQRLFKIRPCSDTYFKNRSRPCLQYQIKRCSGPCVNKITAEDYQSDIRHARLFLQGQNKQLIDEIAVAMQAASDALKFEEAASLRDKIQALNAIQQRQYVAGGDGEADVMALGRQGGVSCVTVISIRQGENQGHEHFYPKTPADTGDGELMAAFISQYYASRDVPNEVLAAIEPDDSAVLQQFLSDRMQRQVQLKTRVREHRQQWLNMAQATAQQGLVAKVNADATVQQRLHALADALDLDDIPTRIECFDISHTQGEATVASCVVYNEQGPSNKDYRRFNITDVTPGDDYAAMRQVLMRRYQRVKSGELPMPSLVLIDGGKGQLSQAQDVMATLELQHIPLLGIAKGPSRKAGKEDLFWAADAEAFSLPEDSPALHVIQQIRDESHRFAITGHRAKRGKARQQSVLEDIPGLGPKRRKALLTRFGGSKSIAAAGIADLANTPGISQALAEQIYTRFHADSKAVPKS